MLANTRKQCPVEYGILRIGSKHCVAVLGTDGSQKLSPVLGFLPFDGSVFFQGIANEEKVSFFEIGYRPNGACDYRHISQENGINYMKMMIAHALTGEMQGYDLSMDNPFFSRFSITFNIWAHEGVIGSLQGLQEVLEIGNVQRAEYLHDVGEEITARQPLLQRVFRAVIVDQDMARIQESILKIQKLVKVCDVNGNNMLYKPFDVSRLDNRRIER